MLGLIITVVFGATTGFADTSALRALGKAYQTNYRAQQNLPDNATEEQRLTVTRNSFAVANKLMMKEMDRRLGDLASAEGKFFRDTKKTTKEIHDALAKEGLTTPGTRSGGGDAELKKKKLPHMSGKMS